MEFSLVLLVKVENDNSVDKSNIKMKLFLSVFILFFTYSLSSQVGSTYSEVKKKFSNGSDVRETLETYDGLKYRVLSFPFKKNSEKLGDYLSLLSCYYEENSDSCGLVIITEPIGRVNAWVTKFKSSGFVEGDNLTWVDYETNLLYKISRFTDLGIVEVSMRRMD